MEKNKPTRPSEIHDPGKFPGEFSFIKSECCLPLKGFNPLGMQQIFKALILNDYEGAPYAEWIKTGEKTIETRHRSFNYRGDIVICCGNTNSVGPNRGKAICLVELWKIRPMKKTDEKAAGVHFHPDIKSFLLRNWRHFNRDFEFAPQRLSGAWQSLFDISLPDDIVIIPRPGIKPFKET